MALYITKAGHHIGNSTDTDVNSTTKNDELDQFCEFNFQGITCQGLGNNAYPVSDDHSINVCNEHLYLIARAINKIWTERQKAKYRYIAALLEEEKSA